MPRRHLAANPPKLALAVAAALGLGAVSDQAAARVYAGSSLLLQELVISVTGPSGDIFPNSFDFGSTNTATLAGASDTNAQTCSGAPGEGGGVDNNCAADPAPPLDVPYAIAPGSTFNPGAGYENSFTFQGPFNPSEDVALADSEIAEAQLVTPLGTPTETSQIAEAGLDTQVSASSSANVNSNAGFLFTFSVSDTADFELDFQADPWLAAEITPAAGQPATAGSSVAWSATLTRLSDGSAVSWAPQGSVADNCVVDLALTLAGVTCTEDADGEDLNRTVGVAGTTGAASFSSAVGWSDFGFTIFDLTSGNWSLRLTETVETNLSQAAVAAPGVVSLLGLGLLGMGAARRRRAAA